MKVLVGDPDAQLVAVLSDTLRRLGHTVLVAHDGPQALAVWRAEAPDLVLLEDAHLPGLAGVVVTRTLRERDDRSPVILMSARPTEAAILRGLESGADDYLTKPISFRQLLARMQALRRRAAAPGRAPVTAVHGGGWDLDLTTKTVITPAGQAVALTPTECRLLALLLTNAGQTLPYARLVEACRGHAYEDATRLLKTHISRLRRKLRLATRGLQAIETVSGVGYRLVLPSAESPRPAR